MVDRGSLQEICACMGQPVEGNPTQYMMERAFHHHGLDWRCLTLEVPPERLGDALRGIRALGFRGVCIAGPHKTTAAEFLDRTTDIAASVGAVNCVTREGDELVGDNTEGRGFVTALKAHRDPAGQRVVILGAGGAARAIAADLCAAGVADVTIVNRTLERAEELAQLLSTKLNVASRAVAWTGEFEVPEGTGIIVQATSIGQGDLDAEPPIRKETLVAGQIVADVVFHPAETKLLRAARQQGATTIDGLSMLVASAALIFKAWTTIEPETNVLREAVEEFLGA